MNLLFEALIVCVRHSLVFHFKTMTGGYGDDCLSNLNRIEISSLFSFLTKMTCSICITFCRLSLIDVLVVPLFSFEIIEITKKKIYKHLRMRKIQAIRLRFSNCLSQLLPIRLGVCNNRLENLFLFDSSNIKT